MQWRIGEVTVTRIEEMVGPIFPPAGAFPDYDPSCFEKHRDWLYPNHVDEASGLIIASMHSWLIETVHHKILIDTCVGNDKHRMPQRAWHELNTPWLQNLKQAGVTPEDIDFVMCTHLHVDHVGWNTRLDNGQWVPTFPNAKYIFGKDEYEFWEQERAANSEVAQVNNQTFDDSIKPVMHLADLVEGETELIAYLLRICPAPGHTAGSMCIEVTDAGSMGLFTGDVCHHPIQVPYHEWNSAFCEIPDMARSTRLRILNRCHDTNALMLPAHFGPGFAGHIHEVNGEFRIIFD